MPIKFRCPNAACGKALTVSDQAAGRTGKCPGCGATLVVPKAEAAPDEAIYDLEPESQREPEPVSRAEAASVPPRPVADAGGPPLRGRRPPEPAPVSAGPVAGVEGLEWIDDDVPGTGGPVVSFDAIGRAWELLKSRMGTWVLVALVVGMAQFGCQLALGVLSVLGSAAEAAIFGIPTPLTALVAMAVGVLIQGVLVGSLYKVALKQIDGGDIEVGDIFTVGSVAPGLALAWLLALLGTSLGSIFLILPGLVFAGLALFTMPAAADGLSAVEALKRSIGTLKRQWLMATLFFVVMWMILTAGVLFCGIGMLFTVPLCVLASAAQYRRSFAPGGMPRKAVVAGSGRVPVWAWGLLGLGAVMPLLLLGLMIALAIPAVQQARQAAQQAVERDRMRQQMRDGFIQTKDQPGSPGGFPTPPGQ